MRTAAVELGPLIAALKATNGPYAGKCKVMSEMMESKTSLKFGTDVRIELSDNGEWVISVFSDASDKNNYVTLTVRSNGDVHLTRLVRKDGLTDKRELYV